MQKAGQVDRTDDQDFKAEEQRFRMCVPPLPLSQARGSVTA